MVNVLVDPCLVHDVSYSDRKSYLSIETGEVF